MKQVCHPEQARRAEGSWHYRYAAVNEQSEDPSIRSPGMTYLEVRHYYGERIATPVCGLVCNYVGMSETGALRSEKICHCPEGNYFSFIVFFL